jgi:hypothetical protein
VIYSPARIGTLKADCEDSKGAEWLLATDEDFCENRRSFARRTGPYQTVLQGTL